jgi:ABC-2 type transport system permease protein
MAALTLATWGLAPRLLPAVWGLYAAFVAVGEFGELWGVPTWAANLSPFAHSPLLPGPDPDYTGLIGLLIATTLLLALGTAAFRRRDLATT